MFAKKGGPCKTSSSSSSSVHSSSNKNSKPAVKTNGTFGASQARPRQTRSHGHESTVASAADLVQKSRDASSINSKNSSSSSRDNSADKALCRKGVLSTSTVRTKPIHSTISRSAETSPRKGRTDEPGVIPVRPIRENRKPLEEIETEGSTASNKPLPKEGAGRPKSGSFQSSVVFLTPRVPPLKNRIERHPANNVSSQLKKCSSVQNVSSSSGTDKGGAFLVPKAAAPSRRTPSTEPRQTKNKKLSKETKVVEPENVPLSLEASGNDRDSDLVVVAGCCSEIGDVPSVQHPHALDSAMANSYSVNLDLVSRMEKDKKVYENHISDLQSRLEAKTRSLDRAQQSIKTLEKEMSDLKEFCENISQKYTEIRNVILEHNLANLRSFPSLADIEDQVRKADAENTITPDVETEAETLFSRDGLDDMEYIDDEGTHSAPSLGENGDIEIDDYSTANQQRDYRDSSSATCDTKESVIRRWQETATHVQQNEWTTGVNQHINNEDSESGVSVADLRDQLTQLKEHQNSTNEELQATLQELCDMQKTTDNVKLQHLETLKEQQILYETIQEQRDREKRLRQMLHTLRCLLTASQCRPLILKTCSQEESPRVQQLLDLCEALEDDKMNFMALNDELAAAYESMFLERNAMSDRCETMALQKVAQEQQHAVIVKRLESQLEQEQNRCAQLESNYHSQIDTLKKQLDELNLELECSKISYTTVYQDYENMKNERERIQCLEKHWKETHGRQENEVMLLKEQCLSLDRERSRLDRLLIQTQQRNDLVEQRLRKTQAREEDAVRRLHELEKELEDQRRDWESYEKDLLKVICVAEDARSEAVEVADSLRKEIAIMNSQTNGVKSYPTSNNNSLVTASTSSNLSTPTHSDSTFALLGNNEFNKTSFATPPRNVDHARLSTARLLATTRLGTDTLSKSHSTDLNMSSSSLYNETNSFTRGGSRGSLVLRPGLVKAKVASFEAGVTTSQPPNNKVTVLTSSSTSRSLEASPKQTARPATFIEQDASTLSSLSTKGEEVVNGNSITESPASTTISLSCEPHSHVKTSFSNSLTSVSVRTLTLSNASRQMSSTAPSSCTTTTIPYTATGSPNMSSISEEATNTSFTRHTFPRRPLPSSSSVHNFLPHSVSTDEASLLKSPAHSALSPANVKDGENTKAKDSFLKEAVKSVESGNSPSCALTRHSSAKTSRDSPCRDMRPTDSVVNLPSTEHISHSSLIAGSTKPVSSPTSESALQRSQVHLTKLQKSLNASSMRNALLSWCQTKLSPYSGVEITNFSSSWNDGLALCGLLHTYLPQSINYTELSNMTASTSTGNAAARLAARKRCFEVAFKTAESAGVNLMTTVDKILAMETTEWRVIMNLVTLIFMHFEVDGGTMNDKNSSIAIK